VSLDHTKEPWFIVGCGYVGTRLARRLLATGHQVTATRRSQEACVSLESQVPGLRARPCLLSAANLALPSEGVLVLSAPPDASAPAPESALAGRLSPRVRLLYLSTTGVYAPGHGRPVSDDFPLAPGSERSQRRLSVETALQVVHSNVLSLRIPGIYGPGRGVHQRLQASSYRIIGKSPSVISRIHVDDLIDAILLLGRLEEPQHRSFVIGDEHPCSAHEHAMGVAARLTLPPPPVVDAMTVSAEVRAMLTADRRIVPTRLAALGWKARYPSWREGLEQVLREEAQEEPQNEPGDEADQGTSTS
jgi:nucleoside-diphosphate-sugar epimerase